MSKLLFNRDTLLWSGTDRDKFPYEIEILNVDLNNLTKEIPVILERDKVNENGEAVYLFYPEPVEVEVETKRLIETTEETPNPVTVLTQVKVPVLNSNDEQIEYQPTIRLETVEESDDPSMEVVYDEETGESSEVQKTNDDGELLYWNDVPSGEVIKCFTLEDQEVQKLDEDGKPLFHKEITEATLEIKEPDPIEVTESHELFMDTLYRAKEEYTVYRVAKFEEEPNLFTYEDVVKHKEGQMRKGTFASSGKLYETMLDGVFANNLVSFNADLGFDFISIPAGGQARTVKLDLPESGRFVTVKTETSDEGIIVSVGALADDLVKVDRNGERMFMSPESSVYVLFENPTDKRIDLHAFALLV